MEFYHLRSFVLVAKTGNLTAAAKQLYTTPPAISVHIKTLEEELKTPLFTRSSKGMTLTDKGKILLGKAENTLNSAIDMVNLAAENQNEIMGNFTLSINQLSHNLRISQLLTNLNENCQGITLNVTQHSTGKAIDSIRDNSIDGGFIYGEVPDDLYGIKLKEQQITTIAPNTSPLNANHAITNLSQQPWIMMGAYCPFDEVLKETFQSINCANIETNHDETRLTLVEQGHGLSFLEVDDAEQAVKSKKIKRLPQLDFTIGLYFAVLKERVNDPVVKAMIQEIKVLWNMKD